MVSDRDCSPPNILGRILETLHGVKFDQFSQGCGDTKCSKTERAWNWVLGAKSSSHECWLPCITSLRLSDLTALAVRLGLHHHCFTDTKIEAGRGEVTCLRSQR